MSKSATQHSLLVVQLQPGLKYLPVCHEESLQDQQQVMLGVMLILL